MTGSSSVLRALRFGPFEVDPQTPELRQNGTRIKLQEQPFQVLTVLLGRPGELVSREELRLRLWPVDTFVDFDVGLNTAIKKLRDALGDSADQPIYIETIPRRGYRFICPVESVEPRAAARAWKYFRWTIAALVVGGALAGVAVWKRGDRGPVPTVTSVAVLPLENLTGDPEQEYLVDGIHDELVTQVAQISSLKVVSRTSVARYKKTKLPVKQIAAELGVDGIVEGAVQRNGDRLHVSAQLVYAPSDRHLWARSYDRPLAEIPTLPGEIAASLARDLHISLSPQEQARMAKAQKVSPEVYQLILKGRYYERKWNNENLKKAIELYRQALDLDPNYALAWARMGMAYNGLGFWAKGKDLSQEDANRLGKAALERAVALDPEFRGAHNALGMVKGWEGDFEGAAREFELARRLEPKWPGPATYLLATGRFDEAVAASRHTAEQDPFNYSVQLVHGLRLFQVGRYDESIVQLKKIVQLDPNIHFAHSELAWNYAKKGMYADAVRECDTANELLQRKQPEQFVGDCGWVYALGGRREQALEIIRRLEKSDDPQRFVVVARIYDGFGDRERALYWVRQDKKKSYAPELGRTSFFSDELKADPRFQDLVRDQPGFPPPFGALKEVRASFPPPPRLQSAR